MHQNVPGSEYVHCTVILLPMLNQQNSTEHCCLPCASFFLGPTTKLDVLVLEVHCTWTLLHNFALLCVLCTCSDEHCTWTPLLHNFALLCKVPLQLQLHYAAHSLSWPNALQNLTLQKHTSGALRQSNTSRGKKISWRVHI